MKSWSTRWTNTDPAGHLIRRGFCLTHDSSAFGLGIDKPNVPISLSAATLIFGCAISCVNLPPKSGA